MMLLDALRADVQQPVVLQTLINIAFLYFIIVNR